MPNSIQKLTELFSEFPTIGSRTAGRFVFYLIKQPKEKVNELILAIQELKNRIKLCNFCFNPYEFENSVGDDKNGLCVVCRDPVRNKHLLCLVEKEADLIAIENTKKYGGFYFIMEKDVFSFRKDISANLRIGELLERIENPQKFGATGANFTEIIIAVNPTVEGKTISILIERALKEFIAQTKASQSAELKITRLARGLPIGGELEYADEETLESALEGRK